MSNKRPLLLWSGGVDSTLVLWELVKNASSHNRVHVDLLYGNCGQSRNKIEAEKLAREKMFNHLREEYNVSLCPRPEPEMLRIVEAKAVCMSQTLPWLIYALQAVDPTRHSEVLLGMIPEDQIGEHTYENMRKFWDAAWAISCRGEPVPLRFPLDCMYKDRVLYALPKWLYKMTWTCETPDVVTIDGMGVTYLPCGKCRPCGVREMYRYHSSLPNAERRFPHKLPVDNWTELKNKVESGELKRTYDPEDLPPTIGPEDVQPIEVQVEPGPNHPMFDQERESEDVQKSH